MPRLVYLASARDDLLSILTHLARESGSTAIALGFVQSLRSKCRALAALPGTMGRPRPELQPDLSSFAFRDYVIFFRYRGDLLEVVAILEGHRDVRPLLDDASSG